MINFYHADNEYAKRLALKNFQESGQNKRAGTVNFSALGGFQCSFGP